MDKQEIMAGAALNAMTHALELKASDRVLVVTDPQTATCGEAFVKGAESLGCDVTLYRLAETEGPRKEVPPELLEHLPECDVLINAIIGDNMEIPFRLQWLKAIEDTRRIRLGHSPGINEDMMIDGPLNVDYALMNERAERLKAALDGAVSARVTTALGTNLHIDISGRPFVSDVLATAETGVNLPCGEIYCAPVETGADGVLVVDGCFGSHGIVSSPVELTIERGRVGDITGDDERLVEIVTGLMDTDAQSRNIAELGIGINPGARLTHFMLEAEKAFRTAHIAFGSNEGMPGGQGRSTMHVDYLFHTPTIVAAWPDGRTRVIIEDGDFRI